MLCPKRNAFIQFRPFNFSKEKNFFVLFTSRIACLSYLHQQRNVKTKRNYRTALHTKLCNNYLCKLAFFQKKKSKKKEKIMILFEQIFDFWNLTFHTNCETHGSENEHKTRLLVDHSALSRRCVCCNLMLSIM